MEKLSAKKKLTVVRNYLSGQSYDEIAAKSGVSKGTVANVVVELKARRFPEAADAAEHIELLRELSIDLKQSKLTPGQCAMGLIALNRIDECGLNPADIDRWPMILKATGNEDEAQEFVNLIYSIQEVQERTGLSLDALDNKAHEMEIKAAKLEPMSRQQEDCRKKVIELTRQRKELAGEVANLEEKYKLLNPLVKDLEKRKQDLLQRTKDMEARAEKAETTLTALNKELQRLQDIGLPLMALAEFSQKVQAIARRHDIKPAELSSRLIHELESLDKGLGLEVLIQKRQLELDKQEKAVAVAKKESETLTAVVGSLNKEKMSLEASIKETRERVSKEIAKIPPVARDTVNRLVEELRRGHDEALADVQRLKDEASEVGKELGRYEGILQVNEWLHELLALVQGEDSLGGKQVRVIALMVLRGAEAWLKSNEVDNLKFSTLPFTLANLIRELEQWKG